MPLTLVERAHVADAGTGRRHGRVLKVLRVPKVEAVALAVLGYEVPADRFVVEWRDGAKTEHEDAELMARYTTQSKDWGRTF